MRGMTICKSNRSLSILDEPFSCSSPLPYTVRVTIRRCSLFEMGAVIGEVDIRVKQKNPFLELTSS